MEQENLSPKQMQVLDRVNAFFAWHRRHHVTGVEVQHIPLLLISIYVLIDIVRNNTIPRNSGFVRIMEHIAILEIWIVALILVLATLIYSIVADRWWLHRWMLGCCAGWWFAIAMFIWLSGTTWLTPSLYACFGISAWWRIADQAARIRRVDSQAAPWEYNDLYNDAKEQER